MEPEPEPELEPAPETYTTSQPVLPRPKPFGDLQPGRGEAIAGQTELHPFVGKEQSKVC
eukprot:COSAG06_NODE_28321_length_576_cov_1.394130_2_plen_58_part_01